MTRETVLRIVVLALLIALVVHMLTLRRARAEVGFIPPGTWLTTERGERVCITTQTLHRGTLLTDPGFCNNWQAPFYPVVRGQQYPIGQGWMRWAKPWPANGNYLQFHTEQGWKP